MGLGQGDALEEYCKVQQKQLADLIAEVQILLQPNPNPSPDLDHSTSYPTSKSPYSPDLNPKSN